MKKGDIVIKSTKQGIVVSLDSSLDFKELLRGLRIRLKDSKVEDLTSEGQVIVDLGNRDVSQVEMSTLESLFFEHGLFLKRIMSRPDLPAEKLKLKSCASAVKNKAKANSSKTKKELAKVQGVFQPGTSIAEVIQMKDIPAMSNSIHHLSEPVKEVRLQSGLLEQHGILGLGKNGVNTEVAATAELEARTEQLPEDLVSKESENHYDEQYLLAKGLREEERGFIKNTIDQPDTLLVQRSLRAGQSIQHAGSVVIMGDVNPGAEVIAGGNIVVMGSFRGVAHAGARGDELATITAFRLQPTQLRIAGHITRPPDGEQIAPEVPEIARVREGIVVIERY
jgi:septum site-determining protein MinC